MNIDLDTNTVISGLFWRGAPGQVLDLARSGTFTLFTSPDLLSELADVLGRKKFSEKLALAKTVRPIEIEAVIKTDPDDDKVLACAKAANAEIITSGDSHVLDLKEYEGIQIMTVNQLLDQYT